MKENKTIHMLMIYTSDKTIVIYTLDKIKDFLLISVWETSLLSCFGRFCPIDSMYPNWFHFNHAMFSISIGIYRTILQLITTKTIAIC